MPLEGWKERAARHLVPSPGWCSTSSRLTPTASQKAGQPAGGGTW